MDCKVCKKTFTGIECLKQHETSKKHLNKIKLLQNLPLEAERPPPKSFIYCSTCDVTFSEVQDFHKHAESFEHIRIATMMSEEAIQRNPRTDNLKNTTTDNNGKKKIQNISLFNAEGSSTTSNSVFKCELCDKYFTGAIPYHQHLQGSVHKKMSIISECNVSNAVNSCFICKICSKEFNGPVPYSIHLESKVHREKEIELQKIELMDTTNKWYCEICNKQCTGYIPYEQHLSSKIHLKNLNGNDVKVSPKSSFNQISEGKLKINEGASTSADSTSNDKINSLDLGMGLFPTPLEENEVGEPPLQKRRKLFHSEAKCNSDIKVSPKSRQKRISEGELKINEGASTSADSTSNDKVNSLDLGIGLFPTPLEENEVGSPPLQKRRKLLHSEANCSSDINGGKMSGKNPLPESELSRLSELIRSSFYSLDRGPEAPERDPMPASDWIRLPPPEVNPIPAPERDPAPEPGSTSIIITKTLEPASPGSLERGPVLTVEKKKTPDGHGTIYRIKVQVPVRTLEDSSSSFTSDSDGCVCGLCSDGSESDGSESDGSESDGSETP